MYFIVIKVLFMKIFSELTNRQPSIMYGKVTDGGHNWYCYNFLSIWWKVIPQKEHFTHDMTNSSKSLWGITFAQETTEILRNMVSRSKQTKRRDVLYTYRDKDNILYQIYVGYYNYFFYATSLIYRYVAQMILFIGNRI